MALEKLTLVTSPRLEEEIVDLLLAQSGNLGFTSLPAHGHGTRSTMSIAEQVRGKQRRTVFEVVGETEALDALLETLREQLPGADAHYWITPVRAAGRL